MDHLNLDLQEIINKGKAQGYLDLRRGQQVSPGGRLQHRPVRGTAAGVESRTRRIGRGAAPESRRISGRAGAAGGLDAVRRIAAAARRARRAGRRSRCPFRSRRKILPKLTDDPIRMYLSQMAEIPLLSREEEVALATRIERNSAAIPPQRAGLRLCHAQDRRHAEEGLQRRVAVRSHDQGLADRTADQGADPGPDAAQPADAGAPGGAESPGFRRVDPQVDAARSPPADPRGVSPPPPQVPAVGRGTQLADPPRPAADPSAGRLCGSDGRNPPAAGPDRQRSAVQGRTGQSPSRTPRSDAVDAGKPAQPAAAGGDHPPAI